jgi:hypothetical protein
LGHYFVLFFLLLISFSFCLHYYVSVLRRAALPVRNMPVVLCSLFFLIAESLGVLVRDASYNLVFRSACLLIIIIIISIIIIIIVIA